MANPLIVDNGNIITINDPNNVNVQHIEGNGYRINQTNGAPPYEDMHIFAELTATNKARTILVSGGDGSKYHVEKNGMSDTLRVNFMGPDQNIESEDRNNPNYLKFTTNYYDGSTGENINYESFGMTSINVVINSSFIPQVSIQFTDVRGLSFFNEKTSPYRILFDFPPPIFNLTIKGYYGKSLSYRLHLVKYTTEFKSENGNFIIDAQFVAMTYAPLTDILFRYVINFPLINEKTRTANPSTSERPTNTNDLIIKLKNLYSAVSDLMKTDKDAIAYDTYVEKLDKNTELTGLVVNYKNELSSENGSSFLLQKTLINSGYLSNNYELSQTTFTEYDSLIMDQSTDAYPTKMDDKLIIAYIVTPNNDGENDGTLVATTKTYTDALEAYKTFLLKRAGELSDTAIYSEDLIYNPQTFSNSYNAKAQQTNNDTKTKYAFIDITEFYLAVYKNRKEIQDKLTELTEVLNTTINNMVLQNLGMNPTIYNIFKVILDDVDTFFDIIRSTSREAEEKHHVTYKNLIINNAQYADIKVSDTNSEDKIYAFPLVIDKKKVCGGFTEERVAPLVLSNSLPDGAQFPELILVDNFINTFFAQKNHEYLMNMKAKQTDDGSHIWVPISPIDSVLASNQIQSPYIGIDNTAGGSSFEPINDKGDPRLNQVLAIVMKRYYILSQAIMPNTFYSTSTLEKKLRKAYIDLYSASEANNLALSITETKYGDNIQAIARSWGSEPSQTAFYEYLANNMQEYYDFEEGDKTFFPMSGNDPNIGINAYINKSNPNYEGLRVSDEEILVREINEASDDPIDVFQAGLKKGWVQTFLNNNTPEYFFGFTKENVLYIKDIKIGKKGDAKKSEHIGSTQTDTRFLASRSTISELGQVTQLLSSSNNLLKNNAINTLIAGGNNAFWASPARDADKLKAFENVVDTWCEELSEHDDAISASTIFSNSKLAALIFMSNFGWTQGFFNGYYQDLNKLIFDNPSVIDVPVFLPLYMGALIDAERNGWLDEIKDYFTGTTKGGQDLKSAGLYIFADYHDVNNLLAEKDKDELHDYFLNFYNEYFDEISEVIQTLYKAVLEAVPLGTKKRESKKKTKYENLIKSQEYFETTIGAFLKRTSIINFSQLTFNEQTETEVGYKSLKSLNETEAFKEISDVYFRRFFSKLANGITKKQREEKDERVANNKLKGDEDIITQTYYSFKNINDKWLSSPVRPNPEGYPFNKVGKKLIDSFSFVDRAMNPIGNTIINPEILIDLFDDSNVSVFGVLTQLLSSNGFEFFPLQNFMTHSVTSWIESFEISTNVEANNNPSFVCMYLGGTSSYPTGIRNGFIDDGIIDITTTNALDFKTNSDDNCVNEDDDGQVENNDDFAENFRSVRAFRVKFGEQNQSMFKDIKIDSKEYPETNESIQILSRISGDNKLQAPIPKGQNLYNLYENRAYKATVTGLGNAMIQPTQYFQLDNVPMFNGAYLILSVEHNIVPNRMVTKFSGTKILQFPIPRVLDSAALFGFGGGESQRTKVSDMSAAEISTGLQAITMEQTKLDELDAVFGIDTYFRKKIDWTKVSNNETKVDFALIKASQGGDGGSQGIFNDPAVKETADAAVAAGVKITYYHFGTPPYNNEDVVTHATEQAQFFVDSIPNKNLPTPNFPLILDYENVDENRVWSKNKKDDNTLWINTFVDVLKNAGYETMVYFNRDILNTTTNGGFGHLPLWFANPIISSTNSANFAGVEPDTPSAWKDWSIWQFSWEGQMSGYDGVKLDLNAMRKSFFNKYT